MLCRCGLIRSAQALCPLYGHIVDFFNAFFQEKMFDIDNASRGPVGEIDVPKRYLMGPGPANADPRVLTAQALPLLGHMHPPFLKIMDEVQQGLRYLFQTSSPYTLCVSGTGHAGMEAAIANLVEPGETVIVGNKGIWGTRVCDMAERFGANVVDLKKEAGKTFSYDELKAAIEEHKPALLFLCQGESSTGVQQSLSGLGELCEKNGTLLLVDTVCSLGGVPLFADEWKIDAIYSGSQKCLSAPPGAAPLFLSPRALEKIKSRKTKVRSYYLDLNLVGDYWGWFGSRSYHHTGMVSMWYAMREALALVAKEGLNEMWQRHQAVHEQLWEGLRKMGLEPFVEDPKDRLCTVNTIKVPNGVDWAAVCKNAMDKYEVEISGGLGPTAGKVWRIGLMGYNATPATVELVLAAFHDGLLQQGYIKH
jgi:alanine-glyoxylate transaminase/serine-glyoxylate transaminase/serine-pyruvate transaminase